MASLVRLYHHYRARLSLKGFMRVVGQLYWRLRDFLRSRTLRQPQDRVRSWALAAVTEMAEKEPTYGYRRVYHALRRRSRFIGRARVRQLMSEGGLQPPPPLKRKRPTPAVVAEQDWPEGRRLQIDATRFRLDDGVAWVYLVKDVKTRQCIAASAASTLNRERAAATLLEGHRRLSALGLDGPRLVQSDAGSDFTSGYFQQVCQSIGQWVRCRVAQPGGMGILERLNRTFKHEFIFRQEVNTLADLKALLPAFLHWYNTQRLHSHLEYRPPAAVLADEVAALLS